MPFLLDKALRSKELFLLDKALRSDVVWRGSVLVRLTVKETRAEIWVRYLTFVGYESCSSSPTPIEE